MEDIPTSELQSLARTEKLFDNAFVGLLGKLDLSFDSTSESDDDDKENEENVVEPSNGPVVDQETIQSLMVMAVTFAKVINKALLSVERATQLQREVCRLERELCVTRAYSNPSASGDDQHRQSEPIELDTVLQHEINTLIESKNKSMQALELKYKNKIFGLNLAVSYLQREVSGRVQQLQISDKMSNENLDDESRVSLLKIWRQLMHEICLARYKTIKRMAELSQQNQQECDEYWTRVFRACHATESTVVDYTTLGQVRYVSVLLEKGQSLGLSLVGGSEYRMPLVIWNIKPDSLAEKSGQFCPGDVLLSIQQHDITGASRKFFTELFKSLWGWCRIGLLRVPLDNFEDYLVNNGPVNFELLYDDLPMREKNEQSLDSNEDDFSEASRVSSES